MPAAGHIRNTAHGVPVPEVTGVLKRVRGGQQFVNYGAADVRGVLKTRVITLLGYDGTDEFKIRVEFQSAERTDQLTAGKEGTVESVAFVRGTNGTAAAIQAELRTLTGDSALTVSGTTDEGPFTVTQGDTSHAQRYGWELSLVDLVGCAGYVDSGPVTYVDATGKVSTANTTASSPGRGAGKEVNLGYSIVTDGPGQTAQTELVPVTVDTAPGGDDQVVISGTEVASGGTGAIAGYAIFKTLTDDPHTVVYTEDADADVTVTGLADATDYYLVGFTQTANANGRGERVSRATPPVFFTTT